MIDGSQCPTHTRTPWGEKQHRYDHRLRYIVMGILTATVVGVVVVSLVFLIDHGTHHWGDLGVDPDNLTHVAARKAAHDDNDSDYDAPFHPPFRPCGDQLEDCQQFFKPFFCCPPTMRCHESNWSPSGLYCCADEDACLVSEKHVPSCVDKTTQCSREMGGGCCPSGTQCSPTGCLEALPGAALFPKLVMPMVESTNVTLSRERDSAVMPLNQTLESRDSNLNGTLAGINETRAREVVRRDAGEEDKARTDSNTPTQAPGTMYTGIKFGEVAFVAAAYQGFALSSQSITLAAIAITMSLSMHV